MARILHVSDWHLGLTTRGVDRLADHEQVLGEICEIAADLRPHLILHTGDLFHTPHPANEAVRLAFDVLHRLEALCPVIVLRGNHDGIEHFRALQSVLGEATRIRLVEVPKRPADGGVVEVEGEPGEIIRVGLLPFLESNRGRIIERLMKDWTTWATQYADGVAGLESLIAGGLLDGYDASKHILLFAAHLHLDVAVPSQSERYRHIVEEYAARAASIPRDVSYAAFGHIHNPQRLRAAMPAWYAGSPIPVDFGEISDAKRVIAVEVHPGTPADVTEHFLQRTGRRLRRIDATLEEIEAMAAEVDDAICDIVVRTPTTTARPLRPRGRRCSPGRASPASRGPLPMRRSRRWRERPRPRSRSSKGMTPSSGASSRRTLRRPGRRTLPMRCSTRSLMTVRAPTGSRRSLPWTASMSWLPPSRHPQRPLERPAVSP